MVDFEKRLVIGSIKRCWFVTGFTPSERQRQHPFAHRATADKTLHLGQNRLGLCLTRQFHPIRLQRNFAQHFLGLQFVQDGLNVGDDIHAHIFGWFQKCI